MPDPGLTKPRPGFSGDIEMETNSDPAFVYCTDHWHTGHPGICGPGMAVQCLGGSRGAVLMDACSGAVIYGKNLHSVYYPASITKILTALIVIEHCNLDDIVTFSHDAIYNVEQGSSSAGLDVGDKMTVRDCLYAMLLKVSQ